MNFDYPVIMWKKISKGIPSLGKAANDRAPTLEELKKWCKYPDLRICPIIHLMASSGIRLGSFDTLQWKHISPIVENNEVIAARLIIYPTDNEEYFMLRPEAYNAQKMDGLSGITRRKNNMGKLADARFVADNRKELWH